MVVFGDFFVQVIENQQNAIERLNQRLNALLF